MAFKNEHINTKDNYNLTPVIYGYENCEKSHSFGPTVRTYWLIHYVVSGKGIFKINNKIYNLKEGEMFVIPPYEETYYEADALEPWSYIWIGFIADNGLPVKLNDTIYSPEAKSIFMSVKNSESYSSKGKNAYLKARIWDLFALLSKEETESYDYTEKALEYIHSEYMYDITIDEIANRLNLDRTYFTVLFKKKTGISPKQYLLKYRMETAKNILDRKNVQISVVASSVGYKDSFTFSKMFKKYYGISPVQYKNLTNL